MTPLLRDYNFYLQNEKDLKFYKESFKNIFSLHTHSPCLFLIVSSILPSLFIQFPLSLHFPFALFLSTPSPTPQPFPLLPPHLLILFNTMVRAREHSNSCQSLFLSYEICMQLATPSLSGSCFSFCFIALPFPTILSLVNPISLTPQSHH